MTARVITVRPAKPVRTPSLVARTVDALGRAIVHGTYRPAMLLPPEAELARTLGVGRNVVRESIKVLAAKGLVRVTQGSGTPVLPDRNRHYFDQHVIDWVLESHDQRDALVDDLATLRFVIEPAVAALAATAAINTEILRVFEACDRMEAGLDDRRQEVEADILFHHRLFEACHKRLMMGFLKVVVAVMRSNFELALNADHMITRYLAEHRAVADAVQRREPDTARAAMQGLLRDNARNLSEMRVRFATRAANLSDDDEC